MPSLPHEALLLLFKNRPELAPELLEGTLRAKLPRYSEVRLESAELTQVVPTEYRADLVVLLSDGLPVLGIVVEAQLSRDPTKVYSWPVYLTSLRARLRCPVSLLVVAVDAAVARWAGEPIELGQPGFVLIPFVLGPAVVPLVTDAAVATRAPELAVLSALAHGHGPSALDIALAALSAASALDDERAALYADLIRMALNDAASAALEAMMEQGKYEYQSDFAKKYIAIGKAEGKMEGKAEGKADALLAFLSARGIAVSQVIEERILACHDPVLLDRWIERAAKVHDAAALFE